MCNARTAHSILGSSIYALTCQVLFCARITELYNKDAWRDLNAIFKHLKKTADLQLKFPKLDQNSLRLLVFKDGSHKNRENSHSQLGLNILTSEKTENCEIIHYQSYKWRRVARLSMAGETLAFTDGFDCAYLIRHDLTRMVNRNIPLLMFTDSEKLFEVLTRSRYTTEKRLLVSIAAAREAYKMMLSQTLHLFILKTIMPILRQRSSVPAHYQRFFVFKNWKSNFVSGWSTTRTGNGRLSSDINEKGV